MVECHEMIAGQVYVSGECGLELKVVKECTECSTEDATCGVESCTFACCGEPLKLEEDNSLVWDRAKSLALRTAMI